MTINIFVLKGDLNGKIIVERFFFFVYILGNGEDRTLKKIRTSKGDYWNKQ